jgi:hypothetical protein
VVIWSGDPFEFSTRVEHVLIRGREVIEPSRQDLLIERYKPKSKCGYALDSLKQAARNLDLQRERSLTVPHARFAERGQAPFLTLRLLRVERPAARSKASRHSGKTNLEKSRGQEGGLPPRFLIENMTADARLTPKRPDADHARPFLCLPIKSESASLGPALVAELCSRL